MNSRQMAANAKYTDFQHAAYDCYAAAKQMLDVAPMGSEMRTLALAAYDIAEKALAIAFQIDAPDTLFDVRRDAELESNHAR